MCIGLIYSSINNKTEANNFEQLAQNYCQSYNWIESLLTLVEHSFTSLCLKVFQTYYL